MSQNMLALKRANTFRLGQAALRRELAGMDRTDALLLIADLLDDPTETVARMKVGDLLRAPNRMGRELAIRLLRTAKISPGMYERKIGGCGEGWRLNLALTADQRWALAFTIRTRYG